VLGVGAAGAMSSVLLCAVVLPGEVVPGFSLWIALCLLW
jgi:hypothetical protein